MVSFERTAWLAHAHVECRAPGRGWWRYARPFLAHDPRLLAIVAEGAARGRKLRLELPEDVSWAVLDDCTLRVVGPFVAPGPRTVSADDAAGWVESGDAAPWPTDEPWARITDPATELATTLDLLDLVACLDEFRDRHRQPAPATHRALLAMARELADTFEVRVLLWFERLAPLAVGRAGDGAENVEVVRRRAATRLPVSGR